MWLIVVCVMVMLMSKMLLYYHRPSGFPPGPQGWPLVGNMFDVAKIVRKTKFLDGAWCVLAKKYGPVIGLRLGLCEPVILVSGRDAVVEMLSRPEFDGRPKEFLFRFRSGGERRGIIFTDGELWTHQKRFVVKTLRSFGFGKMAIEDFLLQNALSLTRSISKVAKEGGPVKNFQFLNSVAILNTLWFIVAGQRFDLEKEHAELAAILNIFHDLIRAGSVSGGILNQLPFLRHVFPESTGFKDFQQRLLRVASYFRNVVAQHRKTRTENGEHRDFIDAYLSEMDAQKSQSKLSHFNEEQLVNTIKDLFVAGVETTKNSTEFVVLYLAAHQKVQSKLHDEIDTVFGRNGLPSIAEKSRMPYLSAVLSEVLRMVNIGPTTLPHRALTDVEFGGYRIRKNYTLLANLKSVHMDREHWGDPEVFRPERFIDSQGKFIDDPWLIPFGLGRRRCMGESLARNTLFVFVACLFQKFHFKLSEEYANVSLEGIDGFAITAPKADFIITER